MNLTDHFPLEEFLQSQEAARLGRTLDPPPEVIDNLKRLCVLVLEPLRVLLGRPIVVSSGYRPDWLNTAIGGAPGSAHLTGRAADINTIGMTPQTLARFIERQNLPADKVILEFGQWVHCQVSPSEYIAPRRQYLTASRVGGQTQYVEGLA
jgi:hypothetical protein